jgi:hypothetical protein
MWACPKEVYLGHYYTAIQCRPDILTESTTATFADDTEVLATDSDPATASEKVQTNLLVIQNWFKKWRIKAN